MTTGLHRKVKVPAVVGTVLTITLAVLAAIGTGVPSLVPIVTAVTTLIHTATGYFTYS